MSERLAITGLGMVTAVGYGVVGSCAAIEAGITRPRPLDVPPMDDGEGGAAPVYGHPISGYTEGFFQFGSWVRLAAGSFENLVHVANLPPASAADFWRRTGLLVLAPIADEQRFDSPPARWAETLSEFYVRPLLGLLRVPIPKHQVQPLGLGHGALAGALHLARSEIAARRLDRVIILGADSYVDPMSVAWLSRSRRLKGPQRQTGLMPGEAGACVLVEARSTAHARSAPHGGYVETVVQGHLPPPGRGSVASLGRQLAEAILQLLAESPGREAFRGDLLLDLNGEEWKAHVWGHAQVVLSGHLDFERCRVVLPSESLGELGAASGPVAVGMAVSAWYRGGASGERAIICSLGDQGQISAVLLSQPQKNQAGVTQNR